MRILNTNEILSNRILIPKWKYQCNTEVLTVPFQLNTCYSTVVKKKFAYCLWSFCDVFFHFCVFIASISFTISFTSISAREENLQWKERGEGLLDTWNYNLNAHCCEISSSNIAQKLILGVKYIKDPTTNGGAPPMTRGVDPPLQRVPRKLKWIAKISKEMPPFVGGCLSECGACNLTYFTHNISIFWALFAPNGMLEEHRAPFPDQLSAFGTNTI